MPCGALRRPAWDLRRPAWDLPKRVFLDFYREKPPRRVFSPTWDPPKSAFFSRKNPRLPKNLEKKSTTNGKPHAKLRFFFPAARKSLFFPCKTLQNRPRNHFAGNFSRKTHFFDPAVVFLEKRSQKPTGKFSATKKLEKKSFFAPAAQKSLIYPPKTREIMHSFFH